MHKDSFDITEEMATWPVRDIIKLLDVLERNGYTRTYFDGYDAAFYLIREKID